MKRLWPDTMSYSANRLFSLDLLRGLDIFLLTFFGRFVKQGLFQSFTPSPRADLFWKHSVTAFVGQGCAPTGWGIWDFGQSLFIFICGAAVPFAIPKRLDDRGRPTASFWKHVLWRVVMLWTLGMLIRGLLTFDRAQFTPYSDTLQTIAVAYLAASLAMLLRRKWIRLVLALALIATLGAIQAFCGDYTQFGNASRVVDERVFGLIGCKAKDFCYVLTTLAWAGMGILGSLVAEILKSPLALWAKAGRLVIFGALSVIVGIVLGVWIPTIRYIYTTSFVFQTLGLSILVLDVLYVLTDIWKIRRGFGFFLLFGRCSLAAWMLSTFFSCGVASVTDKIIVGLPRLLGTTQYQPVFHWLTYGVLFCSLVSMWWRLRRRGEGLGNNLSIGKER